LKLHKGVFAVPFSRGKVYIGETNHSIKTKLKEHKADIVYESDTKFAIVEHSHTSKHHICVEE
jgi:hypothetical protein